MRNKTFYNSEHANQYLRSSVIRVDDDPVLVEGVNRGKMYYSHLGRRLAPGEELKSLSIKSPRINMNPVKLGFINFRQFDDKWRSFRSFRAPHRQWRIGLTRSTFVIDPHSTPDLRDLIFNSGAIVDTIKNKFPSWEKALSELDNGNVDSIAFSREFSVNKDGKIHYIYQPLTRPVGKIYRDDIQLNDNFIYLSEVLERAMA